MEDESKKMICPQCQTPSRPGDKFCEECGAALPAEAAANQGGKQVKARLIQVGDSNKSFPIDQQVTIGRLETCDVPIEDKSVSREHARIQRQPSGFVVEDLGSTNGTKINGNRIFEPAVLGSGDIVSFGAVDYRFDIAEAPMAPEQPAFSAAEIGSTQVGPVIATTEAKAATAQAEEEPRVAEVEAAQAESEVVKSAAGEPAKPRVDQLAQLLGDARAEAAALQEELKSFSEAQQARDAVRKAIESLPQPDQSETELETMKATLQNLTRNPRDIDILMAVSRDAAKLAAIVEAYERCLNALDTISAAVGERI